MERWKDDLPEQTKKPGLNDIDKKWTQHLTKSPNIYQQLTKHAPTSMTNRGWRGLWAILGPSWHQEVPRDRNKLEK